jgi:hypothetical protein
VKIERATNPAGSLTNGVCGSALANTEALRCSNERTRSGPFPLTGSIKQKNFPPRGERDGYLNGVPNHLAPAENHGVVGVIANQLPVVTENRLATLDLHDFGATL